MIKKLIDFLKAIFCKQDHTENTAPKADWAETDESKDSYISAPPSVNNNEDPNVVTLDEVDTIVEECNPEECDCCCCNGDCTSDETENEDEETFEEIVEEACNAPIEEEVCEESVENSVSLEDLCLHDEESESIEELVDGDAMVVEDIIMPELAAWGVNPENLNYQAVLAMIKIQTTDSYDVLTSEIAELLGKTKGVISTSFKSLITKSDFYTSDYDVIKNIDKDILFKDNVMVIFNWIKSL